MHPSFPQPALDRVKATLAANQRDSCRCRRRFRTGFSSPGCSGAIIRSPGRLLRRGDDVADHRESQRFHGAYFRPNNTTVVVVGDVNEAEVVAAVTKRFGMWERGPVPLAECARSATARDHDLSARSAWAQRAMPSSARSVLTAPPPTSPRSRCSRRYSARRAGAGSLRIFVSGIRTCIRGLRPR